MNEITLRVFSPQKTIDPDFILNLEAFVERHGYHVEEERAPTSPLQYQRLNQSESKSEQTSRRLTDWKHHLEAFRDQVGPIQSDSVLDIRELRDSA